MKQKKLLSLSTGLAISLSAMITANAHANPFQADLLKTGYDNGAPSAEKSVEGECGSEHVKIMDEEAAKKADGSCGADHAKENDGSCGANADKTDTDTEAKKSDGSCSAGSCSSNVDKKAKGGDCAAKATDGRCGLSGDGQ